MILCRGGQYFKGMARDRPLTDVLFIRNVRLCVCAFLFLAFCAHGQKPLKAVTVLNAFYLSESYKAKINKTVSKCDSANVGYETLLLRASHRGYRYVIGNVPVKEDGVCHVWMNGNDTVIQGSFFYPHLLDPMTNKPFCYFREMFRKADSLGMILIPELPIPGNWSNLHPALSINHPAADIVMNSYKNSDEFGGTVVYSPPFADNGPHGLHTHLKEYLQRIKDEYDAFYNDSGNTGYKPKVHPKTLPYIYYYEDENYAIARDSQTGAMKPLVNNRKKPFRYPKKYPDDTNPPQVYIHQVLMLGQNNPWDRHFCDSIASTNGGDYSDAIRKLYAYSIWKRAAQIREVFCNSAGPETATQMIIGGMMYDPQFGGATPWQTYHTNSNDPNGYDHVILSPDDGKKGDVLDLPGLNKRQRNLIRHTVIIAVWYYTTDKASGGANPGPPYPNDYPGKFVWHYDHRMTHHYLQKKGFRFIPILTLTIPRGEDSFTAYFFDGLRNTMESLMRPEFRTSALGFCAAWWPCGSEPVCAASGECGQTGPCRCGRLPYNMFWQNSKPWDSTAEQPKEFCAMEYIMNFANGNWPPLVEVKTAATPITPGMIRILCRSIEDGLESAHSGDTVEVWKGNYTIVREVNLGRQPGVTGITLKFASPSTTVRVTCSVILPKDGLSRIIGPDGSLLSPALLTATPTTIRIGAIRKALRNYK